MLFRGEKHVLKESFEKVEIVASERQEIGKKRDIVLLHFYNEALGKLLNSFCY